MRLQNPGEDHAGILRIERIAGKANTENAEDEPGPVSKFEVAGDHGGILLDKGGGRLHEELIKRTLIKGNDGLYGEL
jgi:hypothetical protein